MARQDNWNALREVWVAIRPGIAAYANPAYYNVYIMYNWRAILIVFNISIFNVIQSFNLLLYGSLSMFYMDLGGEEV